MAEQDSEFEGFRWKEVAGIGRREISQILLSIRGHKENENLGKDRKAESWTVKSFTPPWMLE